MRLHHLRLRAFGPFASEQDVDFAPLSAGGLFLLDGPTGAGKSTVLDAITFALYGPGEGGGWGRLHSHFAEPGVAPQVQLEFSLRGCRQRVTRSPEFRRPKRRGDGYTVEAAHVHLERWEGERWVSRSSNKAEVGEMLADDLRLSREQFTQVVLLPQGEFMRFLRADDDARRALLTKLFGTQLYDRITDELERRRADATRSLDAAALRLRSRIGAAAEAAGLDPGEQDALAALEPAAREQRLQELADTLDRQAADAAARSAATAAQLAARRARAERAELAAERMSRYLAARHAHEQHETGREQYEQAAAVLAAAERAEPVRPLLEAWAQADRAAEQALEALLALAPDAGPAWRSGGGVPDLRARAAEASRQAGELTAVVAREQSLAELRSRLQGAEAAAAAAGAALARLGARQLVLPDELASAAERLSAAQAAATALEGLRRGDTALAARLDAARALRDLEPRRDAAARGRELALERYERAFAEYVRLVEARLANMAGELAAGLVDGRPCAVCGAVEHPAPAAALPGAAGAGEVAAADAERRRAGAERDAVAAELARLDEERAALEARAAGAEPAALQAEQQELRASITLAEQAAAGLERLAAAKAELEVEAAELATASQGAAAEQAAAAARRDAVAVEHDRLRAELTAAAAGHPSVAARRLALEQQASALSAIAEAAAALAAARAASGVAQQRAAAEAAATGFAGPLEARAAVLPRQRLVELRAVAAEWQALAARLRGALETDEFAGLDAGDAPGVAAEASAARAALAEAQAAAQRDAVAAERAAAGLARYAAARADVAAAVGDHQAIAEQTAPVVRLARLARGVAGNRRVNLTTYVLRQWFEQVVAAANVRLAGMSSGRYELVRVDEGATRSERAGLTVQVLDRHTGEQRSARSLSGGETFYTSLALALGLADVVKAEAGGVDLDTLFIDEGFGSLDAETLDQVMGVIDELRDRGRTVGIVSHVSELKDRIAERIEVRRLPDGSSGLRVVA